MDVSLDDLKRMIEVVEQIGDVIQSDGSSGFLCEWDGDDALNSFFYTSKLVDGVAISIDVHYMGGEGDDIHLWLRLSKYEKVIEKEKVITKHVEIVCALEEFKEMWQEMKGDEEK